MEAKEHELQMLQRNKIHGRTEFGNKFLEAVEVYLLLRASSTHCGSVFPSNVSTRSCNSRQVRGSLFELR